jgi:hypothetical protein
MSVVVRLPEDVYESARRVAALRGQQAGDLIGEAWAQYLNSNREQLASDLEAAAQSLREGSGLSALGGANATNHDGKAARAGK